MANRPQQGPAFAFWQAVQRALRDLDTSQRALAERAGVSPSIIIRLQTMAHGNRAARARNVRALAQALNDIADEQGLTRPFPDDSAVLQLAGLEEAPAPNPPIDVREAIRHSPEYDEVQKRALYGLLDVLDRERDLRDRVDRAALGQTESA